MYLLVVARIEITLRSPDKSLLLQIQTTKREPYHLADWRAKNHFTPLTSSSRCLKIITGGFHIMEVFYYPIQGGIILKTEGLHQLKLLASSEILKPLKQT